MITAAFAQQTPQEKLRCKCKPIPEQPDQMQCECLSVDPNAQTYVPMVQSYVPVVQTPILVAPMPEPVVQEPVPVTQEPAQTPPPQEQSQQVAQAPEQEQVPPMPKHTITIDFGPTIIGVGAGIAANIAADSEDIEASGFGIAAQYELQSIRWLSIAARFSYMGMSVELTETTEDNDKAKVKMALSSYAFEAHPRVYPFGGSFFLDGTVGYASMSTEFSGDVITTNEYGREEIEKASINVSRNYLKFGGKLGWRVDFGKPGGFIFEHALGFYAQKGMGKKLGARLVNYFDNEFENDVESASDLNDAFEVLEDFVFIGGPRYTFAFGWRF